MREIDEALRALAEAGKPKKKPKVKVLPSHPAPTIPGLVLDDRGKVDPCLHNAAAIIRNAWEHRHALRYDTFSGRMLIGTVQLEERTELEVAQWLQRSYCTRFALGTVQHALRALGFERSFDALEEHVRATTWDGVPRVDTFAVRLLGAQDSVYSKAVGRVLLLSMAARALRPGCKMHTVPILEGGQGKLKSTVCQVLGGPFFAELEGTLGTKEAAEQVEGAWVVEIGELDSLSRAETNAVKAFVSRSHDRFRRAYARIVTDVPRRSVMVGTTNSSAYLRDETGARRFLPLAIGTVELEGLRAERDQLIAEAVHRVEAGESWWLVSQTELEAQAAETLERRVADPWESQLSAFLAIRQRVTVGEILEHLRVEVQNRAGHHQNRVAKLLKFFGYERKRFRTEPGQPWAYVRETTSETPQNSQRSLTLPVTDGTQKAEHNHSGSHHVPYVPSTPLETNTRAHPPEEVLEVDGSMRRDGTHDPFAGLGAAWEDA